MGDFLSKNIAPLLAIVCVVASLILLGVILLQGANEKLTYAIISILSMIVSSIIGFYFGSSAGSAQKSQLIERQFKTTNFNGSNQPHG